MRGKLFFIAGLGVGYVLGTRAGREKFDRMVGQAQRMWESPTVQEAAGVMQERANRLYGQGKQAIVQRVTGRTSPAGSSVGARSGSGRFANGYADFANDDDYDTYVTGAFGERRSGPGGKPGHGPSSSGSFGSGSSPI